MQYFSKSTIFLVFIYYYYYYYYYYYFSSFYSKYIRDASVSKSAKHFPGINEEEAIVNEGPELRETWAFNGG